jgi:hypothetical protein
LVSAQHEPGASLRRASKFEFREPLEDGGKKNVHLETREWRTDAEVDSRAEADVRVSRA